MLSLEALQEVFTAEQAPYWRLYEGRTAKGPKRGENLTEADMDESFALLVRRLELYATGVYTVCMSTNAQFQNSRATQHAIKMGDTPAGSTASSVGSQPVGAFAQLSAALDIADRVNGQGSESIGAIVAGEIEVFKKDMRIKELERENRELKRGTVKDRLIESIVARSPQLLDRLLGPSQQPALGNVGFDDPEEGFSIYGDEDTSVASTTDSDGGDGESPPFSFDDALQALNTIQAALPNENVNQLLWKIAAFVQKDPAQALYVISQL